MVGDKDGIEESGYTNFNGRISAQQAAERTRKRHEYCEKKLLQLNPANKYLIMKECEFKKACTEPSEFLDTFTSVENFPPPDMNERDAVMGGRCDATTLCYDTKDHPEMRGFHIDIVSLYPYICKRGLFPTGHPQVLFNVSPQQIEANKYKGVYYVTLRPPKTRMRNPTVPMRSNGKLMFPLCGQCARDANIYAKCEHEGKQRNIGPVVLTHFELFAALADGYRLVGNAHTVLHYKDEDCTRYNQQEDKGGIFVKFINLFLTEKVESSGVTPALPLLVAATS
ncbi:MAG: hypothetical protein GY696_34760 [Gammaproteobacteria bacterium]|nr:hypothetical protein [Gammaproteobacteria bacterium]